MLKHLQTLATVTLVSSLLIMTGCAHKPDEPVKLKEAPKEMASNKTINSIALKRIKFTTTKPFDRDTFIESVEHRDIYSIIDEYAHTYKEDTTVFNHLEPNKPVECGFFFQNAYPDGRVSIDGTITMTPYYSKAIDPDSNRQVSIKFNFPNVSFLDQKPTVPETFTIENSFDKNKGMIILLKSDEAKNGSEPTLVDIAYVEVKN